MKKLLLCLCIVMLGAQISACSARPPVQTPTVVTDEVAVGNLVKDFGGKLQAVSLLAPADIVKKSMQDNWGAFVAGTLLAKWQSDPLSSPGRLTSSPWPDHIDALSVEKTSPDAYQVKGEIVEMTSTGAGARRPIALTVAKVPAGWQITDAVLGEYSAAEPIVYKNGEFGLTVKLPASWQGYSIITGKWEGLGIDGAQAGKVVETGPLLSIRHPKWTAEKPRQDIPVQVFTLDQWSKLRQEKFHIGAAPIGPSELARNSKYVFALPARYNYAFPEGFEEVEQIIQMKSVQAE